MALIEYTLDGRKNKVDIAIERLRAFEPPDGYRLAFSGGKDSVVIKRLAEMAGVKFEAHYNVTSVDPPELVRFVKSMPDVMRDVPHYENGKPITMWNLIQIKMFPPMRNLRYCCEKLKESTGQGQLTITGVRWAESANRRKKQGLVNRTSQRKSDRIIYNDDNDEARRMVESCYRTSKILINPIVDWLDADVWEFICSEKISYCGLYDCGYKRLGCIGCPMNTNAARELDEYPKYREAYIRAFDRMLEQRREKGKPTTLWRSGEEVMDWWMGKRRDKQIAGQIALELENDEK